MLARRRLYARSGKPGQAVAQISEAGERAANPWRRIISQRCEVFACRPSAPRVFPRARKTLASRCKGFLPGLARIPVGADSGRAFTLPASAQARRRPYTAPPSRPAGEARPKTSFCPKLADRSAGFVRGGQRGRALKSALLPPAGELARHPGVSPMGDKPSTAGAAMVPIGYHCAPGAPWRPRGAPLAPARATRPKRGDACPRPLSRQSRRPRYRW
jgi:hypothetical protein